MEVRHVVGLRPLHRLHHHRHVGVLAFLGCRLFEFMVCWQLLAVAFVCMLHLFGCRILYVCL